MDSDHLEDLMARGRASSQRLQAALRDPESGIADSLSLFGMVIAQVYETLRANLTVRETTMTMHSSFGGLMGDLIESEQR